MLQMLSSENTKRARKKSTFARLHSIKKKLARQHGAQKGAAELFYPTALPNSLMVITSPSAVEDFVLTAIM
ncbi:hypothetical protein KXD40_002091 [Peronospora effusa]|uniref:Uncharacterized protein n=1 Tax=Peronospora effusa TaxID=542832 RepID=A0A3M6VF26_9STRA|nr:hypothetical protein DD238_003478 [Peronospora effusa]RQM18268.1 hypothetical protein DD237_000124 [Peronospora effusa]UIZ26831.1 hypothetical protein KXD40_002091 [Peronospora effusa]